MDVVLGVKQYITRMIKESGAGMKVLLMDKETTSIVSMVYAQSEILQKEVYLFELISNPGRESMKHLNAICFLRPTQANIELLSDELKAPKYSSYFIYFSNRLDSQALRSLAESDEHESVREIKEFFGDYIAVGHHLFSFNLPEVCHPGGSWRREEFLRTTDGILSVMLALRKRPVIRYTERSVLSRRLADEISSVLRQEHNLFAFNSDIAPLLLILDRRDDPVTPLLHQWSYQAMVHEILGINNHRVDLSNAPGLKKDLQGVVLSPEHDEFYRENMYLNFGEIGLNIKELVDKFQRSSKSHAQIESIADMKAFIEDYPQFRKLSGTATKHVAVVGELSRMVDKNKLMGLSEVEQDIVTGTDKNTAFKSVESLLGNPDITVEDCLRLGLLFALRYEGLAKPEMDQIHRLLISRGLGDLDVKLLKAVIEYGGNDKRTDGLFSVSAPRAMKKFFQGLKGVENVYTRHKPYLHELVDNLIKGKLKESQYPYAGELKLVDRPQDIIILIVGGATYAEAEVVANLNKTVQGIRVVLGGTHIHNSRSFLSDIRTSSHHFSRSGRTIA